MSLRSVFLFCCFAIALCGCRQGLPEDKKQQSVNSMQHAGGLAIYRYVDHSRVVVSKPWPGATKEYTYILYKKGVKLADSLSVYQQIQVPLKSIVVTSTTHIPSLEMLGVEHTLVAFPTTKHISSEKTRTRIDKGLIRDLGSNQHMNTELLLDLEPDLVMGFGIDNNNATLDQIRNSGIQVILNGDWNEQSALGKAEWIKLFGALYGLEEKAEEVFNAIKTDYQKTAALAKKSSIRPTVLAGAIYENTWYLPQGNSWGASFIAEAGGQYLWAETSGTGSHALDFEEVFDKAGDADFWIGPGQFTSLKEMAEANPHYSRFKAYRNKKVYSFSSKKGATGGVVYFELAPNRPDLVLRDLVKILHPELMPEHQLVFFEQLQ